MDARQKSLLTRPLGAGAVILCLAVAALCVGLSRGCARIGAAQRNAKAAVPLLAALAAGDHRSPEDLRAAVRRAGEEWAATLGDDDYEVLLARTGEPFEQVLARNFMRGGRRDLAVARPYGLGGVPATPGRCLYDGRPIAHVNVEVRVGAERWVVHFTDFRR